jgi:hypothetical protein
MRRVFPPAILGIMFRDLPLSGPGDTAISVANTDVQDNEATSIMSGASNSSASATITITMYAVADE